MAAPNAEFFAVLTENSIAKAAIQGLVRDNIVSLTESLRGAVKQGHFHRAVLIEGQLAAWESLWPEIEMRAQSYKPSTAEGRA